MMQPIKFLNNWLQKNVSNEHYLFTLRDLRALFPNLSDASFRTLLSRAVQAQYLTRICRGLYAYKNVIPSDGLLLFHVVNHIRAHELNYISLETTLSDLGVISQIPINSISIMSTGRSNTIACGKFGTIEFVHTTQKATDIMDQLTYDSRCQLWRANVSLAIRDMKATHRNCDLINWDMVYTSSR